MLSFCFSSQYFFRVNDAPALKRADCGIAVAGATDAARAAADIILTKEGLGTMPPNHGPIFFTCQCSC